MTAIEEYRIWSATCADLPLFLQPWWLDAAAADAWAVALAKNAEGKIIGVLPYMWRKKWGIKVLDMPALTPYLGPWYDFPAGLKRANYHALEHEVQTQLLAQIPRAWFFRQRWHPQLQNALGFRWQGFQLDIKYTYCIDLQESELTTHFTSALRNNIRNAHKLYRTEKAASAEGFYALNQLSFTAQKMTMPYTAQQLNGLFEACQEHEAGTLYWAVQEQTGIKEAAIWVLWDQQWAYLLASGRSAEAHNGAVALLIEQAIQDAAAKGLQVFDFEGSSLKGVEGFFRQFGGELRMGLVVKKWRAF